MQLTLEIPDEIASCLVAAGGDLARIEVDGFLKAHGVEPDYTMADFELER